MVQTQPITKRIRQQDYKNQAGTSNNFVLNVFTELGMCTCKRKSFPWMCEPTEDNWFAAHKSHFAPVVLSPLDLTPPIITGKGDNLTIGLQEKKFVKRKEFALIIQLIDTLREWKLHVYLAWVTSCVIQKLH